MVTEEELSQMGPEELAEFQKQNCVFCQIASGKIPSKTVYSDEQSIAVLDINPATKGHMLLLPKEHFSVMPQVPAPLLQHLFMVSKSLSQTALKAIQCKGTTIFIANGVAAGQRAPHFMIHIIPRNENDGIPLTIPEKSFPKKDLDGVKLVLKKILSKKEVVEAEIVKESTKPKKSDSAKLKKSKKGKKKSNDKGSKKFDLDSVAELLTK